MTILVLKTGAKLQGAKQGHTPPAVIPRDRNAVMACGDGLLENEFKEPPNKKRILSLNKDNSTILC